MGLLRFLFKVKHSPDPLGHIRESYLNAWSTQSTPLKPHRDICACIPGDGTGNIHSECPPLLFKFFGVPCLSSPKKLILRDLQTGGFGGCSRDQDLRRSKGSRMGQRAKHSICVPMRSPATMSLIKGKGRVFGPQHQSLSGQRQ